MGRLGAAILTLIVVALIIAALIFIVAPRLNWSARGTPSDLEDSLVGYILGGWIQRNAPNVTSPVAENPDNLKAGKADYNEHCAVCHGLDGSGKNRLGADFYPPIPKLTDDTQQMSDGQIFFIVSKGIRYSAMPAFEKNHSADEIWKMILWLRHLARLTPEEKAQLDAEMKETGEHHDEVMQGAPPPDHHAH